MKALEEKVIIHRTMMKTMTHFLCLGLLLLSNVLMLGAGSVLCIEPDGSIAIERALGACCATTQTIHPSEQAAARQQAFLADQPASCGDCIDLALSDAKLRATKNTLTAATSKFSLDVAAARPLLGVVSFCAPQMLNAWHRPASLRAPVSIANLTTSLQV